MSNDEAMLAWIDGQRDRLLAMVSAWAEIGSWSLDPAGLAAMREQLTVHLSGLGQVRLLHGGLRSFIAADGREMQAAVGDILQVCHTPMDASLRVLLAIHMDTVHPPGDTPPSVHLTDGGRLLHGPGVADAKGGLAVMLVALEALQKFGRVDRLGWEVLINADEEIGSPGSSRVLTQAASRHDLGLLFEPALDEAGALASTRKGSGNFTAVIRGRAAHAGRHFTAGRNAVVAAARLALAIEALNRSGRELTVNIASLTGGDGFNVVPDLAILRLNLRVTTAADADWVTGQLRHLVSEADGEEGIAVALHGGFHCPPKPFSDGCHRLLDHIATCGRRLGLPIIARPTGGVCDGNKLAAAGLPTIDTLGVRGGGIHGPDEYLVVDSLAERTKLTALLLTGLAAGSLPWSPRTAAAPVA
jgi:glutamate carboxypeptidase